MVERRFPSLPSLAEQALNATNNVAHVQSELEVACVIAYRTTSVGLSRAIDEARMAEPQCKEYVPIIGEYVRMYSGGPGYPMLKFLEDFSRKTGGEAVADSS